jgi:glycosyltransferase involved in cell wall biosynthesis
MRMLGLSVVMAVYNGAAQVDATMRSIDAQTFRDYELIVVDDGSTDGTGEKLREWASRDARIRVLAQENHGLTRSLIRGCAEAAAPLIARHDCGDTSAPDRFARQVQLLERERDVVLVSCTTRVVGPEGEHLYESRGDGEEIRRSLLHDGGRALHGIPHHGSAVFRRDAYLAAGGYRAEFRFAQDLDLWVRLAARGRIAVLPEALYEARFEPGAISASRRPQQVALTHVIARLRDGGDPGALLAEASRISAAGGARTPRHQAAALYFLASCLRRNGDPRYRDYARAALRRHPLHLRSWLLLLRAR